MPPLESSKVSSTVSLCSRLVRMLQSAGLRFLALFKRGSFEERLNWKLSELKTNRNVGIQPSRGYLLDNIPLVLKALRTLKKENQTKHDTFINRCEDFKELARTYPDWQNNNGETSSLLTQSRRTHDGLLFANQSGASGALSFLASFG